MEEKQQQHQQPQQPQKEKVEVKISTIPFVGDMVLMTMNTTTISKLINTLFSQMFSWKCGSVSEKVFSVSPDGRRLIKAITTVTFMPDRSAEKDGRIVPAIDLIQSVNESHAGNIMQKVQVLKTISNRNAFKVTDEFRDVLSKYIAKSKPYRDDTGRIIWNNVISEVFNPMDGTSSLRVTGIDPIFAFKKVFGNYAADGSRASYDYTPAERFLDSRKDAIIIVQLSEKGAEHIANEIGETNPTGIVTSTL